MFLSIVHKADHVRFAEVTEGREAFANAVARSRPRYYKFAFAEVRGCTVVEVNHLLVCQEIAERRRGLQEFE